MDKPFSIAIMVAVGVFLGALAYEAYSTYRVNKALEVFVEGVERLDTENKVRTRQWQEQQEQKVAQRQLQQKQEAARRQQQQRQAELDKKLQEDYRNTACALNEETGACHCLDMRSGLRVELTRDDCASRAQKITR
jgi:hypothetical protein